MNGDYVFLCGVMWAKYGSEVAGLELVRALQSEDAEVVFLACAFLEEAKEIHADNYWRFVRSIHSCLRMVKTDS